MKTLRILCISLTIATAASAQTYSTPMNDANGLGRQPFRQFFYPTLGANTPNFLMFDLSPVVPAGKRLVVEFIHYIPVPACADNPVLHLSGLNGPKYYFGRGNANRDPQNHNVLLYVEAGQKLQVRMSNECTYMYGIPILIAGRYVDVVN